MPEIIEEVQDDYGNQKFRPTWYTKPMRNTPAHLLNVYDPEQKRNLGQGSNYHCVQGCYPWMQNNSRRKWHSRGSAAPQLFHKKKASKSGDKHAQPATI